MFEEGPRKSQYTLLCKHRQIQGEENPRCRFAVRMRHLTLQDKSTVEHKACALHVRDSCATSSEFSKGTLARLSTCSLEYGGSCGEEMTDERGVVDRECVLPAAASELIWPLQKVGFCMFGRPRQELLLARNVGRFLDFGALERQRGTCHHQSSEDPNPRLPGKYPASHVYALQPLGASWCCKRLARKGRTGEHQHVCALRRHGLRPRAPVCRPLCHESSG